MERNFVRPESHETDTLARRLVPLAFPFEWEHRELTGRDYGIDMIIEIFESGMPTGNLLSLQIKGTRQEIDKSAQEIIFDMPVNTLRYSEMFISPVLLIICPVIDNNDMYFLWLQEYINVVLNYENPKWRSNKTTVRLRIPIENCIKGNEDRIKWISDFPKRTYEFCQLARISAELSFELNCFFRQDEFTPDDYISEEAYKKAQDLTKSSLIKIIEYINELKNLKSIFGNKNWTNPNYFYNHTLIPAEESAIKILNDDYTNIINDKTNLYSLQSLKSLLDTCNDYSYLRELWKAERLHNF